MEPIKIFFSARTRLNKKSDALDPLEDVLKSLFTDRFLFFPLLFFFCFNVFNIITTKINVYFYSGFADAVYREIFSACVM